MYCFIVAQDRMYYDFTDKCSAVNNNYGIYYNYKTAKMKSLGVFIFILSLSRGIKCGIIIYFFSEVKYSGVLKKS